MTFPHGNRPSYNAVVARLAEVEQALATRRRAQMKVMAVITRTALHKPKNDTDRAIIRFAQEILQAFNTKESK